MVLWLFHTKSFKRSYASTKSGGARESSVLGDGGENPDCKCQSSNPHEHEALRRSSRFHYFWCFPQGHSSTIRTRYIYYRCAGDARKMGIIFGYVSSECCICQ